jgi:hypothetical protein
LTLEPLDGTQVSFRPILNSVRLSPISYDGSQRILPTAPFLLLEPFPSGFVGRKNRFAVSCIAAGKRRNRIRQNLDFVVKSPESGDFGYGRDAVNS